MITFDPRLVIGPMQVGALLSAGFYGCFVAQTFMYFKLFPKDPPTLKIIVTTVAAFQLGHFLCLIVTLWTMTVTSYTHPSVLNTLPIAADILILLSSFTCSTVQLFYSHRLWKLSGFPILFIISGTLCVVAQTVAFILVIHAFLMSSLEAFQNQQHVIILLASTSRAAADIFTTLGIAGTLKKRSSGTVSMATIADRLIAWVLETCLVASLATFSIAILLLTLQNSVWFGLYIINANLIANSLLAWFNRRYSPVRDEVVSSIQFAE
ncbi:hypothetical protein DFJ58DRAFT_755559 [Suillus subalutaceus]|uniref:uncharacterized protein n=1 Tax=Suillus subalutaceus TaxID=48586 RepID=UPI001B868BF2|nr:uncharacterized protein DFJ58DRAFT_755559 [Suillus subalutaceus]KAG1876653.1 hypothetical protein DFJ58DRAFT_755559 [Suillus subalutaceus]